MNKKEEKFYLDLLEDTRNIYKDWVDALQQKVNQLETNIDEAIEYIKNNIQEGYSEVFDAEMRWDAVSGDDLLEILERGKE
jgi:hypothetical protein